MIARTPAAAEKGFTLIEMMVAMSISLIVVLGLGQLILVGQEAFGWGVEKVELQRNVAESMEWMARSVRASNHLLVNGNSDFTTFDEDGNAIHRYLLGTVDSETRLFEDSSNMVEQSCTAFTVTANADTTSLTISLELEDDSGNRVAAMTTATLRNRTLKL